MIAEWSGPAWAAPESAERIRTGTEVSEPSKERETFGVLCRALVDGELTAEQFRSAQQLNYWRDR